MVLEYRVNLDRGLEWILGGRGEYTFRPFYLVMVVKKAVFPWEPKKDR